MHAPSFHWHISGVAPDGVATIGSRDSSAIARACATEWLRDGYTNVRIRFSPTDDVEVEFDVVAPITLDARRLRFETHHHLSGQNIADILGVDLAKLHEAIEPLVESRYIEIMDRDDPRETWVLGPGVPSLERLQELAARDGITLTSPIAQ